VESPYVCYGLEFWISVRSAQERRFSLAWVGYQAPGRRTPATHERRKSTGRTSHDYWEERQSTGERCVMAQV
jgi:hypothetical protein